MTWKMCRSSLGIKTAFCFIFCLFTNAFTGAYTYAFAESEFLAESKLARACVLSYKDTQRNLDLCVGGTPRFDLHQKNICPENLAKNELLWRLPSPADSTEVRVAHWKEPSAESKLEDDKTKVAADSLQVYTKNIEDRTEDFWDHNHPFQIDGQCYHVQPASMDCIGTAKRPCPEKKKSKIDITTKQSAYACPKKTPSAPFSRKEATVDLLKRVNNDLRGLLREFERRGPEEGHKQAKTRYDRLLNFKDESCRKMILELKKSTRPETSNSKDQERDAAKAPPENAKLLTELERMEKLLDQRSQMKKDSSAADDSPTAETDLPVRPSKNQQKKR